MPGRRGGARTVVVAMTRNGDVVKLQGVPGTVGSRPGTNTTTQAKEIVMPRQRTTLPARSCVGCGSEYVPTSSRLQKFCSSKCVRDRYRAAGRGYVSWHSDGMPAGTKGAVTELMASVDLMRQGFHVYRAMSPSCPCDLIVWAPGGKPIRIEVKTASRDQLTGKIFSSLTPNSRSVFDVICYVMRDEIVYEPPIEAWGQ